MTWQPPFSPSATALAALGAVAVCLWMIGRHTPGGPARRAVLCGLRVVGMTALAVVLLGPARLSSNSLGQRERPTLHIAVDVSPSMAEQDGLGSGSRFGAAQALWRGNALASWRDATQLRWHTFAEQVRPADDPPTGIDSRAVQTRLYRSLEQIIAAAETGDVVLLVSDGHDTTDDSRDGVSRVVGMARARGVEIFGLPVGQAPTMRVALTATPARVFTDEPITLRVHHSAIGHRPASVAWLRDDHQFSQNDRDEMTVVPFDSQAASGAVAVYRAQVTPEPGEADLTTNTVVVQHLGRRVRVLLVEGAPGWSSRFVIAALRRDRNIDLTTVQSLSAQRSIVDRYAPSIEGDTADVPADDLALPLDSAALERFDVVVTGDQVRRCMTDAAIKALPALASAGSGWVMLGEPRVDSVPIPAPVAASITVQFGRVGAGHVACVTDTALWRRLFAIDDATRVSAEASLRALVRWAATGDPRESPVVERTDISRRERDDTAARPDVVARLAEASGGAVVRSDDLTPLADALSESARASLATRDDLVPVWQHWWMFALIAAPLIVEWFVRRTGGLP